MSGFDEAEDAVADIQHIAARVAVDIVDKMIHGPDPIECHCGMWLLPDEREEHWNTECPVVKEWRRCKE